MLTWFESSNQIRNRIILIVFCLQQEKGTPNQLEKKYINNIGGRDLKA